MIEAGSAALRKVMSGSLLRKNPKADQIEARDDGAHIHQDAINTIIESEIIPRLLLAHSDGPKAAAKEHKAEIAPSEALRFATLPLEQEAAELLVEVDYFLDEGVSVDAIFIDLLAPAARRLGEMWEADEADFIEVTTGLWRLQQVMREVAARTPRVVSAISSPRSILVSTMPGDQHTFGAQMIEEIFHRAGWESDLLSGPERRELLDRVSKASFDLMALTITRDNAPSAIASLITAIRSVSANPHISVMIGGNHVNNNPAIVAEVGADGTGTDARAAIEVAERLVSSAPLQASELR